MPFTLTCIKKYVGRGCRCTYRVAMVFWDEASNCLKRPCYSFISSGYFYSASSSPLLLRGAPDTARYCWNFTPKRYRQQRVKDLPMVPTWRLERDSNPRPFGRKATNLPMSHHAPRIY